MKMTALYERISREDNSTEASLSILRQKANLAPDYSCKPSQAEDNHRWQEAESLERPDNCRSSNTRPVSSRHDAQNGPHLYRPARHAMTLP